MNCDAVYAMLIHVSIVPSSLYKGASFPVYLLPKSPKSHCDILITFRSQFGHNSSAPFLSSFRQRSKTIYLMLT